jgi:hypothetical protein
LYLLAEEMDRKDEEMREVVKKVWPAQARKMLDNLVPPNLGKYWWNLLISPLLDFPFQFLNSSLIQYLLWSKTNPMIPSTFWRYQTN